MNPLFSISPKSSTKLLGALVIALLLLWLGSKLGHFFRHFKLKLKLKKRFTRARAGEKSAEDLLKERGYVIDSLQKVWKLPMWINGVEHAYQVRPDGFALKEGKRYLIEIKTGQVAINPTHSPTRRQLLEYFHGFSVEGVLLVDAEQDQVHKIHFQTKKVDFAKEIMPFPYLYVIGAFFLGILISYIIFLMRQSP